MFSHLWAAAYFAIAAALLLGLLGIIAGLWAEKFDHIAGATNFVIMPMTFLSGTFYLVDRLPEPFRTISHFNPFFYLIDGFRFGFIGHADSNIMVGVISSAVANIALFAVCLGMFRTGWRLKS
jgi:ABC-2 type transport system permease protein